MQCGERGDRYDIHSAAASDLSSSVGREDEAGEAEEAVVPAPAPLPVIDEDGFETVQRRRNPRRACAP